MTRYQYAGPGPVPDPVSGRIIRPGDVREYDAEPPFGPWELLDGPDTEASAEPDPEPEAAPEPELTAAELGELKKLADAAPVSPFGPPVTREGM